MRNDRRVGERKRGKNERKNFELENQEIMEKGENIHQETKLM